MQKDDSDSFGIVNLATFDAWKLQQAISTLYILNPAPKAHAEEEKEHQHQLQLTVRSSSDPCHFERFHLFTPIR